MAITPDEQVKKLDDEISQLKTRKQEILNREKQKQKKERTSRLIKCGELMEEFLSYEGITPDKLAECLVRLSRLAENGALAEKHLNCEHMPSDKFEEHLKHFVKMIKENVKK